MDAYAKRRSQYSDISGALAVLAATDDSTLVTGKTAHTIFVQRIWFYVTTDAAQSMSIEDSNGTPKKIWNVPASPGVGTPWSMDFGPDGVGITEAKNLVANFSAAGLAGNLHWQGYMKPTSNIAVASGGV